MGLDAVELVIRFENAFGIRIPDEVAEQMTTPRKVTNYVLAQVAVSEEFSCLSQQAFYFLRRKFVGSLKVRRSHFSPT
ncbi:MAG: acyl carrier protein, partial [Pyrinomonadaceae bacterium]